ncbi:hypothetical protein EV363DRAFT_462331 [Boletus edulis]|nr:hypothetical protein EV363DRAFT_462331 [Boletus edulis]
MLPYSHQWDAQGSARRRQDTRESHAWIAQGSANADDIPAKSMVLMQEHGMHKGLLTPTIYPRNPLYHVTVPKTPPCHIHGTHKGRPDADKIPAKAMHGHARAWHAQGSADADNIPAKPTIPSRYRKHLTMIAYMGRTRVGLTQTRYPRKPCMERTRVG